MEKLKILVVDDSVVYRKAISDILKEMDDVEVAGVAHSGKIALEMIKLHAINAITLDYEMPGMGGLEVLERLKKEHPDVEAIMVSSHTLKGAETTVKALQAGAFDFATKPSITSEDGKASLKQQLKSVINSLLIRKRLKRRNITKKSALESNKPSITESNKMSDMSNVINRMKKVAGTSKVDIIGIAISTGGPNALKEVIPKLPANLNVPVVIVQHMPPMFTKALADSLNKNSDVTVLEGADDMILKAGTVYIAPGGKQMKISSNETNNKIISITDAPPENNCKPSADYTFRHLAKEYKSGALGVIMTGMGADGVKGLCIMKHFGSKVIAQDEHSCVVYGMPMEAVKAGVVDIQVPLADIAGEITKYLR
jgi:two-component system chemotaxis response regulator CheB